MEKMKFYFLVLILLISMGNAQYLRTPDLSGVGLPFFHTEVFPTFTEDGQQQILRVYAQILNDDLTFVKADTGFSSEVQMEIYLSDDKGNPIMNRIIVKKLTAADFERTNSRQISNIFSTDVPIDSGEYEILVTILDKNSSKQVNRKIHFTIPSFKNAPLLMSNLLFFSSAKKDPQGKIMDYRPNLTNNFSGGDEFIYAYFNTIAFTDRDSMQIHFRIKDTEGRESQNNVYLVGRQTEFKEHFIRFNRSQFDRNKYIAEVTARIGNYHFKTEKVFSFFWTISPESPKDLTDALEQLQYLAEEDSIRHYLKKPYEEQKAFFERFWEEMDPNPETEKNELMDEYYRRVNFANQNFSTLSFPGWQTDRGRIFVKFGEPDDIERHPFEMGSYPYEIWRYYQLKKIFLFIDRTGFGDYYLHPSYLDEEFN